MKFFRMTEQILEPCSIVHSSRMFDLSDVGSFGNPLERALGLIRCTLVVIIRLR